MPRYVFTCDTGRCGEGYFTQLLQRHVPGAYVAWEEPHAATRLPGVLGDLERHVRRRFVETHELLGRGRTLAAFDRGDTAFLEAVARRRLAMIERTLRRTGADVYIDVSKFFVRGLHVGFRRLLPAFSLILLVRDPIENMRSYLNRGKRFTLDSTLPDSPANELRLTDGDLSKGELYLWIWCETILRFRRLIAEGGVERHVVIRTERLNDEAYMDAALDALDLPHSPVVTVERVNTNVGAGYGETRVRADDVATFERFVGRVPASIRERLPELATYAPAAP